MKIKTYILLGCTAFLGLPALLFAQPGNDIRFTFYDEPITIASSSSSFVSFQQPLSQESVSDFYTKAKATGYTTVIQMLKAYRQQNTPDDWLFYQLIRKTAQQISPKEQNYKSYTLHKWLFLTECGYDATVSIAGDSILLYVQCDENIYNIPFHIRSGKQYVCLNYHDYNGKINFIEQPFTEIIFEISGIKKSFSYKVTQLPEFSSHKYEEKNIHFEFYNNNYNIKLKINPEILTIFANYPVVDYDSYFNIPLSKQTHESLITALKRNLKTMSQKNGVDFLMQFTRYSFGFKKDIDVFGKEKRMSAEETLLYSESDCEDRAALFFLLVKEIYNLPMIILSYPDHITIGVKFNKPIGNTIEYNGEKFSICEPTPQKENLAIGSLPSSLRGKPFEVVYQYYPPHE